MSYFLGLRFRDNGQLYYFEAGPFELKCRAKVLVKTEQGVAMAQVAAVLESPPAGLEMEEIKPILRPADEEDLVQHRENLELAQEGLRYCRQCIADRALDMKLVDVEILHDRSKMVFYFTAPGRIDFRELVKDLVKAYRTRIELRQIGVRHETQMVGAIGNCGQMCCCARFIRKFQPVTIKMAKEQNLFLNPAKISGMCGRLLCCLAYEQNSYEEFQRRCPKFGKKYQTTQGPVKVLRSNIFRETLSVLTEDGDERELTLDEWRALAGEVWTPYITPQQAPAQRHDRQERAPRPVSGGDQAGRNGESEPAEGPDGDPSRTRAKRKRKRKPKTRRPEEGGGEAKEQPGE
ncbi:hypothetical protein JCM15519_10000 [Fundidesulfovibrio butyratiphilus]